MAESFSIAPSGSGPLWTIGLIALLLTGVLALLGFTLYSSRNVNFEVSDAGLTISGDLYGRTIPMSDLLVSEAQVMDISSSATYGLSWKTNGVGLPGYKSGWFKLKNGDKALVFITDQSKVVYVPTTQGYTVLMSPGDPAQMLAQLQAYAG